MDKVMSTQPTDFQWKSCLKWLLCVATWFGNTYIECRNTNVGFGHSALDTWLQPSPSALPLSALPAVSSLLPTTTETYTRLLVRRTVGNKRRIQLPDMPSFSASAFSALPPFSPPAIRKPPVHLVTRVTCTPKQREKLSTSILRSATLLLASSSLLPSKHGDTPGFSLPLLLLGASVP